VFQEEVAELIEAAQAGVDKNHIAEEAADVFVTAIGICLASGVDTERIIAQARAVVAKNDAKTPSPTLSTLRARSPAVARSSRSRPVTDYKRLSQEQFGTHAANYVNSEGFAKGYSLQRLLELTAPQPDWRVLDVATGGGHTARTFAPYVRQVQRPTDRPDAAAARAHLHDSLANRKPSVTPGATPSNCRLRAACLTCDLPDCGPPFPCAVTFCRGMRRVTRPAGWSRRRYNHAAGACHRSLSEYPRPPARPVACVGLQPAGMGRLFPNGGPDRDRDRTESQSADVGGMGGARRLFRGSNLALASDARPGPRPGTRVAGVELPAPGSGEAIRFNVQQAIIVGCK